MFLSVCAYIGYKRTPDFVKAPIRAVISAPGSLLSGRQAAQAQQAQEDLELRLWEQRQQEQRQRIQQQQQQQDQYHQELHEQRMQQQQQQRAQQQEDAMRLRMDASGAVWELDEEAAAASGSHAPDAAPGDSPPASKDGAGTATDAADGSLAGQQPGGREADAASQMDSPADQLTADDTFDAAEAGMWRRQPEAGPPAGKHTEPEPAGAPTAAEQQAGELSAPTLKPEALAAAAPEQEPEAKAQPAPLPAVLEQEPAEQQEGGSATETGPGSTAAGTEAAPVASEQAEQPAAAPVAQTQSGDAKAEVEEPKAGSASKAVEDAVAGSTQPEQTSGEQAAAPVVSSGDDEAAGSKADAVEAAADGSATDAPASVTSESVPTASDAPDSSAAGAAADAVVKQAEAAADKLADTADMPSDAADTAADESVADKAAAPPLASTLADSQPEDALSAATDATPTSEPAAGASEPDAPYYGHKPIPPGMQETLDYWLPYHLEANPEYDGSDPSQARAMVHNFWLWYYDLVVPTLSGEEREMMEGQAVEGSTADVDMAPEAGEYEGLTGDGDAAGAEGGEGYYDDAMGAAEAGAAGDEGVGSEAGNGSEDLPGDGPEGDYEEGSSTEESMAESMSEHEKGGGRRVGQGSRGSGDLFEQLEGMMFGGREGMYYDDAVVVEDPESLHDPYKKVKEEAGREEL
jgi:hypothetical protein